MLPQAEQARKAIWEAINPHTGIKRIDEAFPPAIRKRTRNNEMFIELLCGSSWQVVGSDNYNALVGSPPVGITFSEWALADPHAWAYMRPILRENGGWATFIYTPRGRNHGWTLLESARAQGWFTEVLPATASGVFTDEDLRLEKAELIGEYGRDLGENMYEQEYLCSFDAAILGAIYARWVREAERTGRLLSIDYDPSLPLYTAWDFGWSDATVIWWFQVAAKRELRIIDFYRATSKAPKHYAEVVFGHAPDTDEIKHSHRKGWQYAGHYFPHDAANKTLAAGGRSTGDLLFAEGISGTVLAAVDQDDQISAARDTLDVCWFDTTRCKEGLDALRAYHFPWDDKLKRLKDAPLHDWSSDPCDAFEVIAQVWRPPQRAADRPKPRFLNEVTADEVFFPKEPAARLRDRI